MRGQLRGWYGRRVGRSGYMRFECTAYTMPIRCTMCVVQCVPLPICPDCDRKSIKCTHNVSSYIRTYIYTYIHRTPCSVCSEQTCAWIITRNNPVKSRVLIINEYCPGKWLLLLLLPLLLLLLLLLLLPLLSILRWLCRDILSCDY